MKYQCEHSDTGICLSCFKVGKELNDAYNKLWQLYEKMREEEDFEVATRDVEDKEVLVTIRTKDLLDLINRIDFMCGR